MQEILFKAKAKCNSEWVFGYYVNLSRKHYIVPDYASAWYGIEVDYETVCRYTGIADEIGNNIFENDIVILPKWCGNFIARCEWVNNPPDSCPVIGFSFVDESGNIFPCADFDCVKVIGNIHDKED